MGGDYSRLRFDPRKHYAGVLLQQGRVLVDSDWNEAETIRAHLLRTLVRDLLGPCAFPRADGAHRHDGRDEQEGQDAGFAMWADGPTVTIGAGHAWIDGLLCENEADVDAEAQPDLPGTRLPTEHGAYVFYLDVWQREVTAAEDPSLREPALGGPDTSVRLATIWQVRPERVSTDPDRDSSRRLPADQDTTDARFAASGAYTGQENRLYRIEIHDPGGPNEATFKWSRDNGSTVARVLSWTGRELRVEPLREMPFRQGDRLEILDRVSILHRRPGPLVDVAGVDGDLLALSRGPSVPDDLIDPIVRRWDGGPTTIEGPAAEVWYRLGDGVEVRLDGTRFRTGDYWLVPARTAPETGAGTVDWPTVDGEPELRPPFGIDRYRCPLALLALDETGWRLRRDLRPGYRR